jgi:hypothetical protein
MPYKTLNYLAFPVGKTFPCLPPPVRLTMAQRTATTRRLQIPGLGEPCRIAEPGSDQKRSPREGILQRSDRGEPPHWGAWGGQRVQFPLIQPAQ